MDTLKDYYMMEEAMASMEIEVAIKPKQRKMASCFVNTTDSLNTIFSQKSSEEVGNWGVYKNYPFPIVTKDEYFETNGTYGFEYHFVETYDEAVKYMTEMSYKHYKSIGDKEMTQCYISIIEQLQEEKPELWV